MVLESAASQMFNIAEDFRILERVATLITAFQEPAK